MEGFEVVRRGACLLTPCLTLALSLACGSEDGPAQQNPGGSAGSSGTAGAATGGSAGSAGDNATGGFGGSAGSPSDDGSAGSAGSADSGTDAGSDGAFGSDGGDANAGGKRFVPEGITTEYVGQGPSGGLEVVAFTLLQEYGSPGDPAFFVAVKNSGPDPICYVDMPSDFLDAAGTKLASTIGAGAFSAPVYRTFGSFAPCLDTGDIGMALITLNLGNLDVSQVRKIQHGFTGNIDPNATKVTGVAFQNVQIMQATTTSVRATGAVVNNGTSPIADPDVAIYAVDPAGRPFGVMTDIELVTIPVGGSWNFQTLSFSGEVQAHADYVEFDTP
jgi:hypothetical protein